MPYSGSLPPGRGRPPGSGARTCLRSGACAGAGAGPVQMKPPPPAPAARMYYDETGVVGRARGMDWKKHVLESKDRSRMCENGESIDRCSSVCGVCKWLRCRRAAAAVAATTRTAPHRRRLCRPGRRTKPPSAPRSSVAIA